MNVDRCRKLRGLESDAGAMSADLASTPLRHIIIIYFFILLFSMLMACSTSSGKFFGHPGQNIRPYHLLCSMLIACSAPTQKVLATLAKKSARTSNKAISSSKNNNKNKIIIKIFLSFRSFTPSNSVNRNTRIKFVSSNFQKIAYGQA